MSPKSWSQTYTRDGMYKQKNGRLSYYKLDAYQIEKEFNDRSFEVKQIKLMEEFVTASRCLCFRMFRFLHCVALSFCFVIRFPGNRFKIFVELLTLSGHSKVKDRHSVKNGHRFCTNSNKVFFLIILSGYSFHSARCCSLIG